MVGLADNLITSIFAMVYASCHVVECVSCFLTQTCQWMMRITFLGVAIITRTQGREEVVFEKLSEKHYLLSVFNKCYVINIEVGLTSKDLYEKVTGKPLDHDTKQSSTSRSIAVDSKCIPASFVPN